MDGLFASTRFRDVQSFLFGSLYGLLLGIVVVLLDSPVCLVHYYLNMAPKGISKVSSYAVNGAESNGHCLDYYILFGYVFVEE